MKIRAVLFGAALLLSGVGTAQAADSAQDVESKLTMTATMSITDSTSDTDSDSKITKVRFATKDFLAFMNTALGVTTVKSAVVRRATVPANDDTGTDANILTSAVVLLDADKAVVAQAGDALVQSALAFPGAIAAKTAQAIKEDDTKGVVSIKAIDTDSRKWVLDANDDATAETTDEIELEMLGVVTSSAKRKFKSGDDQGLQFSSRVANLTGGMTIDSGVFGATANLAGTLSGTIKAAGETIQVP